MPEVVVDANVWRMVDGEATAMQSEEEKNCILACQEWLESFILGDDRLVIDSFATYRIMSEYRRNVRPGGVAESLLNELSGRLFHRIVLKEIVLDADGVAVLTAPFRLTHAKDRVYIAVAVQCEPYAPILNATDTDWEKDRELLFQQGLPVLELCPDYVRLILRQG